MVTGLPKTKRGNDAIQVYVERLCKIKHFLAIKSTAGAEDMARHFVHTVVRQHGVPERVISDRDPRFTAKFFKAWSRLMGTVLGLSTSRHAQTDGQSEREIKTLIIALRSFCNEHRDDWDDYLDALELGFNSRVQASTGLAPFEMLYGARPRLPTDVAAKLVSSPSPAAADRMTRIQEAINCGRGNLERAQERQIRNAHRREASFKVGEKVWLATEGLRMTANADKLCSRFVGPLRVVEVINPNAYRLELPPQLKALHHTFNIDRLKPHRPSDPQRFPGRPAAYDRPPPEVEADSNGDAVWVVESVVAKRQAPGGRGTQYLVSWKGYPPEENTWEARSNLLPGARDALAEFERAQEQPPAARLVGIELNPGPGTMAAAAVMESRGWTSVGERTRSNRPFPNDPPKEGATSGSGGSGGGNPTFGRCFCTRACLPSSLCPCHTAGRACSAACSCKGNCKAMQEAFLAERPSKPTKPATKGKPRALKNWARKSTTPRKPFLVRRNKGAVPRPGGYDLSWMIVNPDREWWWNDTRGIRLHTPSDLRNWIRGLVAWCHANGGAWTNARAEPAGGWTRVSYRNNHNPEDNDDWDDDYELQYPTENAAWTAALQAVFDEMGGELDEDGDAE
jgi:hypothetical protein